MASRAVLDLNVLVSGVLGLGLGRSSPPVVGLAAALEGAYQLVASPRLLEDLHAVLQRPRLALGAHLADSWAELIGSTAEVVHTPGLLAVLRRDPADNEVLECALEGAAPFVVTGNLRHFEELRSAEQTDIVFRGVRVLTPREFVESVLGRRW